MEAILLLTSTLALGQIEPSVLSQDFPRITRRWADATGRYRVEAKLVDMTRDVVILEKKDGKAVNVPVDRLDKAKLRSSASARSYASAV